MSFAQRERALLAQLLLDAGPEAPTLCQGWATRDMAVHLFIRENRPWAAPGVFFSALEHVLEKETAKQMKRPYEDVVRDWAAGPPLVVRPVDSRINAAEHFIHHEDVRRGEGFVAPREFSKVVEKQLLDAAAMFGRISLRALDVPVILTPPDLPPVTVGNKRAVAERGDSVVRVFGEPGELLMWVSGRDVAEIKVEGQEDLVAQVKGKLGV
ncbi:TIGR03085 family metal-binding protein [Corynebacterium mayonis]|uniref:TIGR03085 family metal-binding protein n=1 Tax=Corynebacterium mayonis TaxID=3062461 RepID=UPI00313FE5E8